MMTRRMWILKAWVGLATILFPEAWLDRLSPTMTMWTDVDQKAGTFSRDGIVLGRFMGPGKPVQWKSRWVKAQAFARWGRPLPAGRKLVGLTP